MNQHGIYILFLVKLFICMGIRPLNWFEVRNSVQFYQEDKSHQFSWWKSVSVRFCWELGILPGRQVCLRNSREINNLGQAHYGEP